MNDKELRLKVLELLYRNDMQGKKSPGAINELEGLDLDEYHRASLWLIKHNLAEGHISKAGGYQAWANHVTRSGMDIIEKLIDTSVENVKEKKISFSSKASSYVEQFLELVKIWASNPDLLNHAWENLTKLIGQ